MCELPSVRVALDGNVIAYVNEGAPDTVNDAAATVPVVDGRVTPPEPPVVRVLLVDNTTVPLVDARTAMLPKFISVTLAMVIGVMIVADAVAVADTCAKDDVADAITITAAATSTLEMFFILFVFLSLSYLFEFVYRCLIGILLFLCQNHNQLIINDLFFGTAQIIPSKGQIFQKMEL